MLQGSWDEARAFAADGLAVANALGDEHAAAGSNADAAAVAAWRGDHDAAFAIHETALAQFTRLGDVVGIAITTTNLGDLALIRDDLDRAVAYSARGPRRTSRDRKQPRYRNRASQPRYRARTPRSFEIG